LPEVSVDKLEISQIRIWNICKSQILF